MLVLTTIIPVFLIILGGYLCRYYGWLGADFWRGAEKLVYFLLFPMLLVSKMSTANLEGVAVLKPLLVFIALYLIMLVLLLLARKLCQVSDPQFTSVFQGAIRFNTYIVLAVVEGIYSSQGLVIAVIMASMMIPLLNIFCVLLLEYYSSAAGSNMGGRIIKSVLTNPLILACAAGMGINASGLPMPMVLGETLDILAATALPLGLLTVGAALSLKGAAKAIKPLVLASTGKFVLLPLLAFALCVLVGIEGLERHAIMVITLAPTATASYMLARQLGGDHQLMATIITVQTLLASVFLPLGLIVFF